MKNTFTNRMGKRLSALLPMGVPRYVRCYFQEDEPYADCYTICFTGKAGAVRSPGCAAEYSYRAMSGAPFHPQGIGQWGSTKGRHCDTNRDGFAPALGRKCHLGRRIRFQDLPEDCRKLVLSDYREIWNLNGGKAGAA